MELGWGALGLLLVAIAVVWFLQDSLAARERANAEAQAEMIRSQKSWSSRPRRIVSS